MLSDYVLTVFGAIQRDKKYSDHFQTQHYGLNSVWQKAIGQKRWFNPRHIVLTVLFTAVLAYLLELGNTPAIEYHDTLNRPRRLVQNGKPIAGLF